MKAKILFIIAIICIADFVTIAPIMAQSIQLNQQKYWTYRKRFFDKFILVNTTPDPNLNHFGYNIPADIRHLEARNSTDMIESHRMIHWGDATIYLAHYMCVLATEYKLLLQNGQSTTETLSLLVAALNTFNRLDYNAETYYQDSNGNYGAKNMNGFFVRDDIPKKTNWSDEWKNHFLTENLIDRYADIDNPLTNAECSADQMWHLIMAMALVKKLVGTVVANFDSYSNMSLGHMAEIITRKMILMMHSDQNQMPDHWYIPFSLGTTPRWILRNAVSGQKVHRGAELVEFFDGMDYAFGEAGTKIAGTTPNLHYALSEEHRSNLKAVLNLVGGGSTYYVSSAYNVLSLETIIGDDMGSFWQDHSYETLKYLLQITRDKGIFEHLPLIFSLLHDETDLHNEIFDLKSFCESLLNSAPMCDPYCYGIAYSAWVDDPNVVNGGYTVTIYDYDYESADWSSPNRLFTPESLVTIGGQKGSGGEFNGLDYMLLYNLYQLVYNNTPSTINLDSPSSDIPITILGYTFGTDAFQLTFSAKNEIVANNTVHSDGNVKYAAGSKVTLLPGFHAEAGSSFRAYIDQSLYFHKYNDSYLYSCNGILSINENNASARLAQDTTTSGNSENLANNERFTLTENKVKLIQVGVENPPTTQLQQTENSIDKDKTHVMLPNNEGETNNDSKSIVPQAPISNSNKTNGNTENKATNNKPYTVSVYPNPNTGKFLVEISGAIPIFATVELRDLLGKTVYSSAILQNSNTIDLTASPSGIYFITVCAGKDCWLGKVVKE